MADLRTQLRAYVEATIERVDVADVADVLAVRAVAPERRWYQRPVAVALGAAAAVLVLVGGVTFLTRWLTQGGPATTTTVVTTTTTLAPTTTTTVPPTTTTTVPPTTTTVPGLDPATAAAWAAFTLILPEEAASFPGPGWNIEDLAANGSVIVAVGSSEGSALNYMSDAAVWISAEGLNWERVSDPDDLEYGGKWYSTVVAAGPGFVAGGGSCDTEERCPYDGWRAALWTSVDGRDWARVPHDPAVFGDAGAIRDLLVRPSEILALGISCTGDDCAPALWSSPDGLTWSRTWTNDAVGCPNAMDTGCANALAEGDAGLVVIGSEPLDTGFALGAVWTSADGTAWQRVPHDPAVFGDGQETTWAMLGVAAGADGFVVVGTDGTDAIVWTSPDGVIWQRLPHDPAAFGNTSMKQVIAWGDGYLAAGPEQALSEDLGGPYPGMPTVSSRPTIWVSPDGRTWHRIGIGEEDAVGEAWGLGQYNGMAIVTGLYGDYMEGQEALWVNQQPPPSAGG